MIQTVRQIRDVGRYENFAPSSGLQLGKLTLIYGDNGLGKTTLAEIFNSLALDDPAPILERVTLGSASTSPNPLIKLETDSGQIIFANGAWHQKHSQIEVFDSCFVHNNIFSGDRIEAEHRQGLSRIIIGEHGVALANQFSGFAEEISSQKKEIQKTETELERKIHREHGGLSVDEFVRLEPIEDLLQKLENARNQLDNLKKQQAISSNPLLSTLELPSIPWSGFFEILSSELHDVSLEAERRLKSHVAFHQMEENGEDWLRQGLDYMKDDLCPFCGQTLSGIDLLSTYQSFFDKAYADHKRFIADFVAEMRQSIQAKHLLSVQKVLAANTTLTQFWQELVGFQVSEIDFNELETIWQSLGSVVEKHLERKLVAPLEVISPSQELDEILDELDNFEIQVTQYNTRVNEFNLAIEKIKDDTSCADEETIKGTINHLENTQGRFVPATNTLCQTYLDSLAYLSTLENQKDTVKKELDEHSEEILEKYQGSVSQYLDDFGATFTIDNLKSNFAGGKKTSTNYNISVRGSSVKLKAKEGQSQFRSTLSEGDKTTLAFAFFLARLENDADLQNKTVVIDDPVSSLGMHRKRSTQQAVARICGKAKQVIVLSHDLEFLGLLWDEYIIRKQAIRNDTCLCEIVFQPGNPDGSTIVANWDIETAIQGTYFESFQLVLDFVNGNRPASLDIAQKLRPLVEGDLKRRFPEYFVGSNANVSGLGDMIGKIEQANPSDTLAALHPKLKRYRDFNEATREYHHTEPNKPTGRKLIKEAKVALELIRGT